MEEIVIEVVAVFTTMLIAFVQMQQVTGRDAELVESRVAIVIINHQRHY